MAAIRNAAIGALRLAGVTNIAAANRHHARDSTRPLALLGITYDFAGALTGKVFLLDVTDHDPDTAPQPADADTHALGGRGLTLAQSFSLDVGWYCTLSTKHVWATFTNSL